MCSLLFVLVDTILLTAKLKPHDHHVMVQGITTEVFYITVASPLGQRKDSVLDNDVLNKSLAKNVHFSLGILHGVHVIP